MTIVACLPQTPLMRIFGLVAVEAAPGSIAKLYRLRVTAGTRHCDMGVAKLEVRKCMIEGLAVELDDVRISPLVIRMTMVAFLFRCLRIAAMKPSTDLAIGGNILVAGHAESRLRPWRKRLVTVAALLFKLSVSRREWPGHDELLEHVLCLHQRSCYADHTDPDNECL